MEPHREDSIRVYGTHMAPVEMGLRTYVDVLLPWCGELRFPLGRLEGAEEGLDNLEPSEAGALPRQKRARMGLRGVFQELEQ
jgi:hypothetical protein